MLLPQTVIAVLSLCIQVGSVGDEEEWKVLYEKENDPEAQLLEVPNLTPFTHYRSVLFLYKHIRCIKTAIAM